MFCISYSKKTKEDYPQFTKPGALVVLQQHFMFHRMHRRMCGWSDFYKHFTDKVRNSCSPPDNWLGNSSMIDVGRVWKKPEDPTSCSFIYQNNKKEIQYMHPKLTFYTVGGKSMGKKNNCVLKPEASSLVPPGGALTRARRQERPSGHEKASLSIRIIFKCFRQSQFSNWLISELMPKRERNSILH